MKKFKLKILIITMLLVFTGCAKQPRTTLNVGVIFSNQDFLDESKLDVEKGYIRDLLFGYNCVDLDPNNEYVWNLETIQEPEKPQKDVDGNLVYTIVLNSNKWNEGTIISAKDYIFSLLTRLSVYRDTYHIATTKGSYILGYDNYIAGESEYLSGVKLVNDKIFTVTIDKSKLDTQISKDVFSILPLPMDIILNQENKTDNKVEIISNDNGSKVSQNLEDACKKVEKYSKRPEVTSGPYKLVDSNNERVSLTKNKYFTKDVNGETPVIENIVFKYVDNKIKAFTDGSVDLITGIFSKKELSALEDTGNVPLQYTSNINAGLIVSSEDSIVKQAFYSLLDNEKITKINNQLFKVANGDYSSLSLEKMKAGNYTSDIENIRDDKVKSLDILRGKYKEQLTYLGIKDDQISEAIKKQLEEVCKEINITFIDKSVSKSEYFEKSKNQYDVSFVLYEAMQDWHSVELLELLNAINVADEDTYQQAWIAYQNAYMQQMPILPLITINYCYVSNGVIGNVDIYGLNEWAKNICQYKL